MTMPLSYDILFWPSDPKSKIIDKISQSNGDSHAVFFLGWLGSAAEKLVLFFWWDKYVGLSCN